jgi:hypothetical protein
MKVDDQRVKDLYDYLGRVTQTAYNDDYLLTTPVLSRSPFLKSTLQAFTTNRPAPKLTWFYIVKNIFLYYVKNSGRYFIQLAKHTAHFFSRQKYHIDQNTETQTLIDILFYTKQIIADGNYKCTHFPGIEEVLSKQGKPCAYTTKFFESSNPFRLFNVFKILKKNKRPVLTEFQLLNFVDYCSAIKFLLMYPFHAMKLISQLGNEPEDDFLVHAIFETLSGPGLLYYFQLLYGRRISQLPVKNVKCISWYENQPREKCFYKGLRAGGEKVDLYGAQLYVWPSNLGSTDPEESEIKFGVVPDKIVVNGPYFLPKQSLINYRVGPSLRSERLFQVQANPADSESILVLMPYFEPEIEYFLKLVNQLEVAQSILLKFHPGVDQRKFASRVKQGVQVVRGDLFDFLINSKMVIGMATGTLAEAASLGIPAISIENNESGRSEFSHSFMPDLGKGIIWDSASNFSEVVDRVNKFNELMAKEPKTIAEMGERYKEIFFCEPTREKIIEAFELDVDD